MRCLVRPGSEAALKGFESIDRVPGDVLEPDKLAASVEGCGALVHLVGIIREHRTRGITFDRLHTQATANMLAVAHAQRYGFYVKIVVRSCGWLPFPITVTSERKRPKLPVVGVILRRVDGRPPRHRPAR